MDISWSKRFLVALASLAILCGLSGCTYDLVVRAGYANPNGVYSAVEGPAAAGSVDAGAPVGTPDGGRKFGSNANYAYAVGFGANNVAWSTAYATPEISVATPTSDVATVPLLIQSQAPWASAVTNLTPGNLVLNVPVPVGAGSHAPVVVQDGATAQVSMGFSFPGFVHGNRSMLLFGNVAGAGAELISPGNLFIESATSIYLEGTVNFRSYSAGVQYLSLAPTTGLFTYSSGATTPGFAQTAAASTSAGSGAAGQGMSVTAQAGQAATGGSHNGGAGGNLLLSAGLGGTSGSATAGATGLVSVLGLMGGSGTTPFGFSGQTSPNTVACGTGGTQTISAAQAIIPVFLITGGTLTSDCVIDFSTNATTGFFMPTIGTFTSLNGHNLSFKNGTTTLSYAALPAHNMVIVQTGGSNVLALSP